jgi:hypothetical protein
MKKAKSYGLPTDEIVRSPIGVVMLVQYIPATGNNCLEEMINFAG